MENQVFYSEEFSKFISSQPPRIIRKGNIVLGIVLIIIFSLSFFIKYSDTIPVRAIVVSRNYPKAINSRIAGRIIKLIKKDAEVVRSGDHIAYLESTANYEEMIQLNRLLYYNAFTEQERIEVVSKGLFQNLGDVQPIFNDFKMAATENIIEDNIKNRLNIENKERQAATKLEILSKAELEVAENELQIAEEDFERRRKLYNQKVISLAELKEAEMRYLARVHPVKNIRSNLILNEKQKLNYDRELLNGQRSLNEYQITINNKLSALQNAVIGWINNYVLRSTTSGVLRLRNPIQEGDYIQPNESLFFIEGKSSKYHINIEIPQQKFGKVSINQSVRVKLDGYPYEEFGAITGHISYISKIATENIEGGYSYYSAQVDLESFILKKDRRIILSNNLTGTGEIITKKERLITYILLSIIKAVSY